MSFCPSCGSDLIEDAAFCHRCGSAAPLRGSAPPTRKTEFAGKVVKCPQCGGPLEPFETACGACGFVFRDSPRSESMQQFADALSKLSGSSDSMENPTLFKEKLTTLIRGFVIPNNKQDIVEFFILAQTNIVSNNLSWSQSSSSTKREVADAWLAKLNQAYSKAMISFADREERSYIESAYTSTIEAIEKAISDGRRSAFMVTLKSSIGIFAALFLLLISYALNTSDLFARNPYGQWVLFELGAGVILWLSTFIAGRKSTQMSDYAIPIIGCFAFILLSISGADDSWCLFAQIAGLLGLVILFSSHISSFLKNKPNQ